MSHLIKKKNYSFLKDLGFAGTFATILVANAGIFSLVFGPRVLQQTFVIFCQVFCHDMALYIDWQISNLNNYCLF